MSTTNKPDINSTQTSEIYAKYRDKFDEKLEPVNSDLVKKIKEFFISIFSAKKNNWITHLTAEHMSRGILSSEYASVAFVKTLKLLRKIENPTAEITNLIEALDFAYTFREFIKESMSSEKRSQYVKDKVKNLEHGKSLAISSSSNGHAMILMITCEGKETPKKYNIVQHNQGEGVMNYHYAKVNAAGKYEHQTGLEITGVSEASLCGPNSRFFNDLLVNYHKTTDNLYENILPQLDGKIARSKKEGKYWSDGQLGGSCTSSCLLSLIRSQLTTKEYKDFREQSRLEISLKFFKKLQMNKPFPHLQKIVALEVLAKLEHSYSKRDIPLPQELKELKSELEKATKPKPIRVRVKPLANTPSKNLKIAVEILRKGNFSKEALTVAEKHIEKVKQLSEPYNKEESRKMLKIMGEIKKYTKDLSLTQEQYYSIAVLSAVAMNPIHQFITDLRQNETSKKQAEYGSYYLFAKLSLRHFTELNLYEIFSKHSFRSYVHETVLKYEKVANKVQIPEKLSLLMEKMNNKN